MELPDDALDPRIRDRLSLEDRAWWKGLSGMDPCWSIDYFLRFFTDPLAARTSLTGASGLECACGLGYNAMAFALAGGGPITGYDLNPGRITRARLLAERLGLSDRVRFEVSDIHALPEDQVDIVFSLQTLEHVPRALEALISLASRAKRWLSLSTPNGWFPKDGHDTGLMFAHWLPLELRRPYVAFRGRNAELLHIFLKPEQIESTLKKAGFARMTRAYNFDDLEQWLDRYPCFFPYGKTGRFLGGRQHKRRWRVARICYGLMGASAQRLSPVYEGLYQRQR